MAGVEGPCMSVASCTCLTALKEQGLGPHGGAQPRGSRGEESKEEKLSGG